jgi:hypothetical protein
LVTVSFLACHRQSHRSRIMNCCNEYGTCTKGKECPVHTEENSATPEAGNVWFVGPEPVTLNVFESIAIYLVLTALGLISIGLLASGGRYFYLQFFN